MFVSVEGCVMICRGGLSAGWGEGGAGVGHVKKKIACPWVKNLRLYFWVNIRMWPFTHLLYSRTHPALCLCFQDFDHGLAQNKTFLITASGVANGGGRRFV